MFNSNRTGKSGGGRGGKKYAGKVAAARKFAPRRDSSMGPAGRDFAERRAPMQLHKAVCTDCGNACEVPFKPSGDKPVLCLDCFRNKGSESSRRPGASGPSMHKTTCAGCGKTCEVPFRPSGQKPIYCRECFGENMTSPEHSDQGPKKTGEFEEEFKTLNAKLDKILKMLAQ